MPVRPGEEHWRPLRHVRGLQRFAICEACTFLLPLSPPTQREAHYLPT